MSTDLPAPRPIFDDDDQLRLGMPDRQLTPNEAWALWQSVYDRPDVDWSQVKSYQIVIAWRVTRALAFKMGQLHLNERLAEVDADLWTEPQAFGEPSAFSDPEPGNWSLNDLLAREGGLSLLPPKIRGRGRERFCWAVTRIAEATNLFEGTRKFPNLGNYGLRGMLHPDTVLDAWPSKGEILHFEDELIAKVGLQVIKKCRTKVEEWLREFFAVSTNEARGLIALGIDEAKRGVNMDLDAKMAIAEARLEDFIWRAREAGDLNNEMKGHKALATVQGLTRTEPEDSVDTFIKVIGKVADSRPDPTPKLQITVDEDTKE